MRWHKRGGYELTKAGSSLVAHILPLHRWADAWASRRKRGG
jgi:DNA-binding HxlR family transcriptional regulator